ncbi:MAG: COG1361 S-layer family protein [Nanoarchaeota archaeon]
MRITKTVLLIMLLCIFLQPVYADQIKEGTPKLSLVNQLPDPVEPGEYVDVRFRLENIGEEALEDVRVEALSTHPFSVENGSLKEISSMGPFQKDKQGYVVKYKVKVANDAVEGENQLKVRVKTSEKDWTTYEFDLNVQTIDANLDLASVDVDPSPAKPGDNAKITVKAKNMADSSLKDVKFKLDLTLESLGNPELDSLPFAPASSGIEKKISRLQSNEETTIDYELMVYPTAESKVYQLPLVIEYKDHLNNQYKKTEIVGVVVNSEPDLSIVLYGDEALSTGKQEEASFRFTNKGLTDIKFLTVNLEETTDFEVLSSKEVYLGNIDSDDYEVADYQLYIPSTDKDTITVPVEYEYMDANNNKYTKTKEIEAPILTKEREEKLGLAEGPRINPVFYLLGAAIVIFLLYRFYKKRKQ